MNGDQNNGSAEEQGVMTTQKACKQQCTRAALALMQ